MLTRQQTIQLHHERYHIGDTLLDFLIDLFNGTSTESEGRALDHNTESTTSHNRKHAVATLHIAMHERKGWTKKAAKAPSDAVATKEVAEVMAPEGQKKIGGMLSVQHVAYRVRQGMMQRVLRRVGNSGHI